ncbi:uncharacterized protein LOC142574669 [Dermacentor variabilis]|uniref:uncharacterized protein LOC142574669 n=1 Tax=Dermacentor variabilis TaxID=34621 RepID=UPI003F5BC637
MADTARLLLPDLNLPFTVQTDAREYGIGTVLLQKHQGKLHPLAFARRTLTGAERNYTVTEKECLAIVFALKQFDMYLDGADFTIQTDHQALTRLSKLQNPAGRLARWALSLQKYNCRVEYRKGTFNKVADALSRAPLSGDGESATEVLAVAVPVDALGTLISRQQLLDAQLSDDQCNLIRKALDGANPAGRIFVDTCKALGVQHKRTTPYHPQANITECVNRNLKTMLVAFTEQHKDWDVRIQEMAFATRTTVNRSTGFTPAAILLGRELRFPIEHAFTNGSELPTRNYSTFTQNLSSRLAHTLKEARENLDLARLEHGNQYNKGRRPLEFAVGDEVLRRTHPLSDAAKGFAASLAPRWDGPYVIARRISSLVYLLREKHGSRVIGPVSLLDLKAYYERPSDS